MSDSPFVPVDEVTTQTGLTKRQVRNDVSNGYLPGRIDHRDRIVILRVEWNAYLTGEWTPAEPGSHKVAEVKAPVRKPVGIHSIHERSA